MCLVTSTRKPKFSNKLGVSFNVFPGDGGLVQQCYLQSSDCWLSRRKSDTSGSGQLPCRLQVTRWGQEGIRSCKGWCWWPRTPVDPEELTQPRRSQEHCLNYETSMSCWGLGCRCGCLQLPEVATASFHRASKSQVWYNQLFFFFLFPVHLNAPHLQ